VTAPNVRPIDRWFIDEVLPHERAYLEYARRTLRDQDAGDLVQEAYAKLFTLDGWAAITNPPGYVMRIIRHIAIERIRRARVVTMQPLPPRVALEIADDRPDSFRVVAARTQMTRVQHAISSLPERCRIALVRRRLAEETPREIASDLGISISTFEKRLARAVELLTHALTPQEGGTAAQMPDREERKALL
jgi:RNA polymerase sigma-70 factor (ECF subfamily)